MPAIRKRLTIESAIECVIENAIADMNSTAIEASESAAATNSAEIEASQSAADTNSTEIEVSQSAAERFPGRGWAGDRDERRTSHA
jgi:hypothetical protein